MPDLVPACPIPAEQVDLGIPGGVVLPEVRPGDVEGTVRSGGQRRQDGLPDVVADAAASGGAGPDLEPDTTDRVRGEPGRTPARVLGSDGGPGQQNQGKTSARPSLRV